MRQRIIGGGEGGAAGTNFVAPFVLVAYGWTVVAQIWAAVLLVVAVAFWVVAKDDPDLVGRKGRGGKSRGRPAPTH